MPDDNAPDDDRADRAWDKKKKPRDRDDEDDDYEERPRRRRRSREDEPDHDPALNMIVPLNTSALAIIAGYVGLISVLCVPAPFALLFGILALIHLKKNPKLDGKVRAIFAIVMGVIFSGVLAVFLASLVLKDLK